MLNSSVRLALLTSVTCALPAGQPPDEERIDGAEQHVAALGALAQAGHRVEQVLDLRAGEIRIERPARSRSRNVVFEPVRLQLARRSAR